MKQLLLIILFFSACYESADSSLAFGKDEKDLCQMKEGESCYTLAWAIHRGKIRGDYPCSKIEAGTLDTFINFRNGKFYLGDEELVKDDFFLCDADRATLEAQEQIEANKELRSERLKNSI